MPCHSERQESEPLRLPSSLPQTNIQSANPKSKRHLPGRNSNTGEKGTKKGRKKKTCGLREGENVVIHTGANPNPGSITGERDEREKKWEAFHAVRNN
jgi:hypothetical protein